MICTKKLKITEKGHKQERKRFLAKSKGCRDEDAMPLVHNVNQQEDNIEQNSNTINLLTDHRSLHQWLFTNFINNAYCQQLKLVYVGQQLAS